MPICVALKYWRSIDVIESREMLMDLSIVTGANLKQVLFKEFNRNLRKKAYPSHLQKEMDFEDFAKEIGIQNGQ